tara:strand:+ start:125 stop:229 length:105 start_codon:yes stop_codon:yes gene_type:complete
MPGIVPGIFLQIGTTQITSGTIIDAQLHPSPKEN